jgi:hypothetical protein
MHFWIAALLPKMASAKAQAAGHSGSMVKACNAGRRSDPKVHNTL